MADLTQSDSLQKIIAQKDNEINDMMGTLNEIWPRMVRVPTSVSSCVRICSSFSRQWLRTVS